jgi:mRNA (guanine-N7-)-methyltransferase
VLVEPIFGIAYAYGRFGNSLAEDYNLELSYRKPFADVWKEEKDDPILGPLSERMGVREKGRGPLLVSKEEMEAASES